MLREITYFSVFLITAYGIVTFTLFVSKLFQTKKPVETKLLPYECGNIVSGDPRIQFKTRYYIFALLLIIFDVEMLFLFPWALVFKSLGLFALIEMLVFIAILLLGLLYTWRKGALKWI